MSVQFRLADVLLQVAVRLNLHHHGRLSFEDEVNQVQVAVGGAQDDRVLFELFYGGKDAAFAPVDFREVVEVPETRQRRLNVGPLVLNGALQHPVEVFSC